MTHEQALTRPQALALISGLATLEMDRGSRVTFAVQEMSREEFDDSPGGDERVYMVGGRPAWHKRLNSAYESGVYIDFYTDEAPVGAVA